MSERHSWTGQVWLSRATASLVSLMSLADHRAADAVAILLRNKYLN